MELYQLKFFSISLAPECTVQSQVFRMASEYILLLLAQSLVMETVPLIFCYFDSSELSYLVFSSRVDLDNTSFPYPADTRRDRIFLSQTTQTVNRKYLFSQNIPTT